MSARPPYIGQPIERIEDLHLLRGKGRYVDDIHRPNMLHASILRSSMAHGILNSIDVEEARALEGVALVLTAADLGSPVPQVPVRLFPNEDVIPICQPVLAHGKVRFVGEPIAIVIAESPAIAEDALDLISVDIDQLDAVSDVSVPDQALLFDDRKSNTGLIYEFDKGDIGDIFETAEYTRRERLHVHRHTGMPMETRGVVSEWDSTAGKMTSWGAVKVPFANRKILAGLLNLPEESVEMIEGDAGGSFGVRGEFFPEDFLVPYCARLLNRPVKWIEDRREHFLAVSHARDATCDIEIACKRDGTILAIRANVLSNVGAYFRTTTPITPRNIGQFIPGSYRISNYRATVSAVMSNKSPSGTYRGPGRYEADFFRERMFNLVAQDLKIDPITFRKHNLLTENELPWAFPTVTPNPSLTELDTGDYEKLFDICLKSIGWYEKQHLQGELVDGVYHGLAASCCVEGGAAGPRENARLVLEKDGLVSVYVGSSAVGQGVQTILTQIAADALDLPMEKLQLFHGSTTYVKEGWGSYHSRSTVMGGNAILIAANELKRQICEAAAEMMQCDVNDVEYSDGVVTSKIGSSVSIESLGDRGLSYEATFSNSKHTYTYGSHAAHVTVDPETGRVKVLDYVAVEDAGRVINPLTLHGQSVGGIVQGLGGALLENLSYGADGQMFSASFADYLMPLATDFPNVRSVSVEHKASVNHPLGAKGAGEGGTIPVGGVIGNAVAAALSSFGVEPLELPLSADRVWQMIQDAKARKVS